MRKNKKKTCLGIFYRYNAATANNASSVVLSESRSCPELGTVALLNPVCIREAIVRDVEWQKAAREA